MIFFRLVIWSAIEVNTSWSLQERLEYGGYNIRVQHSFLPMRNQGNTQTLRTDDNQLNGDYQPI